METVEHGMYVRVDYTGTLENGEVFDSSNGCRPIEVQIGAGQLIEGFEKALMGMSLNEKKSFTIEADEAYGQRDERLTHTFDRADVPAEIDLTVGRTISLNTPERHNIPARIARVDDKNVTVDMNHPLAGETLNFEIEVMGISSTPTQVGDSCGASCGCSGDCSTGGCH